MIKIYIYGVIFTYLWKNWKTATPKSPVPSHNLYKIEGARIKNPVGGGASTPRIVWEGPTFRLVGATDGRPFFAHKKSRRKRIAAVLF